MDYVTFSSTPSGRAKGKTHIVIVGAGIIGVCTAYYLTLHPDFSPKTHHITVLESRRVAGGASGKAGGLLALWAFPQQLVPLSFRLHQELSDQYNGAEEWGYRRLTTVSLEGNLQDAPDDESDSSSENVNVGPGCKDTANTPNTSLESLDTQPLQKRRTVTKNSIQHRDLPGAPHLPGDLNWIREGVISEWSRLGGSDSTAQVHPYRFTNFLLKKALESGAVELILGKVESLLMDDETGAVRGLEYFPTRSPEDRVEIQGEQVVLAMGPWTSKILPDCPISGLRAHSITVAPHRGMVSPYAIFTELKVGKGQYVSPEIYARQDEVYVCGEGDTLVDLPETTDDVEVIKEKCDQLFHYVGKLSPNLARGHILKRQACYLPVLDVPSSSGPLIGETNVEGLYLASGHSCWGINNAPGTGKLMAELLLEGEVKSADISALDPSLYFDASE